MTMNIRNSKTRKKKYLFIIKTSLDRVAQFRQASFTMWPYELLHVLLYLLNFLILNNFRLQRRELLCRYLSVGPGPSSGRVHLSWDSVPTSLRGCRFLVPSTISQGSLKLMM